MDGYCVSNDNVQTSCANGNDPAPDCVRRPAPTGNTLADTALDIACDLRKGFGCLYNRPAFSIMDPKYSHTGNVISNPGGGAELFDFDLWAQHGNSNWWDSSLHNCGHCLFWCTWLPVKVYNTVYHDSRLGAWGYGDGGYFSLSADSMCDPNTSENQMLNIKKVSGGPQSGDIPCYQWDEDGLFDHVGIVYEKVYFDAMEVGINVVESNSYPFLFYDKDPSGGTYSGHGATIMHFMRKGGHF
ncbi:MAG: hypothetical protein GX660_15600 [Clostridiaceae bacterium]|nr:hypothetical protein [Clostridiaceae bacterium]